MSVAAGYKRAHVYRIATSKADQCLSLKVRDGRRCMLLATHRVRGDIAPLSYCRTHARVQAELQRSTIEAIS